MYTYTDARWSKLIQHTHLSYICNAGVQSCRISHLLLKKSFHVVESGHSTYTYLHQEPSTFTPIQNFLESSYLTSPSFPPFPPFLLRTVWSFLHLIITNAPSFLLAFYPLPSSLLSILVTRHPRTTHGNKKYRCTIICTNHSDNRAKDSEK